MSHDDAQPTDDSDQWWDSIDREDFSRRRLLYLVAATVAGILAILFGIDRQPSQNGYGNVPYGEGRFGE